MKPIQRIRIRRNFGPRPGWKLVIDGRGDKNLYATWRQAVDSAIFRLRRRAVQNMFDAVESAPPGEYTGIPAAHIHGDDLRLKRQNLAAHAYQRGLRIDIETDHDEWGNYDFYIRLLGRRNA